MNQSKHFENCFLYLQRKQFTKSDHKTTQPLENKIQ